MCLAIPMRIDEIRADGTGVADLDGVAREVALSLIADPRVGDYVIVHAGYAIEKLDRQEADERLALFREIAAAWEARPHEVR
ncbi:MAG: HypC/HybG/HupF family hydrogenase formation chaperone [Lentisphaerae bacterium]|nr:HypC/HybG/HupF family hydrogenase formation chaperone [Lentisphaerota bacterium]